MNNKYNFDDFMSYKIKDKRKDLGKWLLKDKELFDYHDYTVYKKTQKKGETPQEKEARLLREKSKLREDKIDKLLGL